MQDEPDCWRLPNRQWRIKRENAPVPVWRGTRHRSGRRSAQPLRRYPRLECTMDTRSKWHALVLLAAIGASAQQACRADWRDTLIQAVAPRLVDRAINYVLRKRTRTESSARPRSSAPSPTGQPGAPVVGSWHPSSGTSYYKPDGTTATAKKSVFNQAAASSKGNGKLYVPPPPKQLVPPPPAGVPTDVVLGLYPQHLNQDLAKLQSQQARPTDPPPPQIVTERIETASLDQKRSGSRAASASEVMPKPAPDFRNLRRR